MAEVSRQLGRGAYEFAYKICKRHRLVNPRKQGRSAVRASSLSAGFLLGEIQNGALCGAENAVIVGASQDGYTRATPLCGVAKYYDCIGLYEECSLTSKNQVQNIEIRVPQFGSCAKFWRTFCNVSRQQSLESRCLFSGQCVFTRAYTGNGARSEPLYKTKTGYYEILEVIPTATQAQIKTAYYKQSFIYHPDRNAGSDEATDRFSEISEAYTVLGNKALRKRYDRGLLTRSDLATVRPPGQDIAGSSAKPQSDSRRSVMGANRQGGVFDFDTFFKQHYGEQLRREKDIRERKERMLRRKQESIADRKSEKLTDMAVLLMMALAAAILVSIKM
ncbi:uncharacterized protein [Pempheris klunzingeri]|uniref:uncharacterized protein n=1 Tax=Pempheris klunzingeri TaxID=3127111 RepID=UPI003980C996